MTVGIGVICERGKAVVLAADRMVTSERPVAEYEGAGRKISRLSRHAATVISGSFSDGAFVLRHAKPVSAKNSIEDIAEALLESRSHLRRRIVEEILTKRLLGIDLEQFGKHPDSQGNALFRDVALKLAGYQLFLNLLVGGVDESGAQLFQISDGTPVPIDHKQTGFGTIGSGHAEAHVSLARRGYRQTWSLTEAVYGAYEAKRAAELATGVGVRTDIAVIAKSKQVRYLTRTALKELSKIYHETRRPLRLTTSQTKRLESHLA